VEPDPVPRAEYFDGWYADMTASPVKERPGWRDGERAMWEEAAALDPGDDPALRAFHEEGVRSLPILGLTRRVMASATAP